MSKREGKEACKKQRRRGRKGAKIRNIAGWEKQLYGKEGETQKARKRGEKRDTKVGGK